MTGDDFGDCSIAGCMAAGMTGETSGDCSMAGWIAGCMADSIAGWIAGCMAARMTGDDSGDGPIKLTDLLDKSQIPLEHDLDTAAIALNEMWI